MSQITLNQFSRLAELAGSRNTTFIQVSGDELKTTGRVGNFFTFSATKRNTIETFMNALRAEYGSDITDTATRGLRWGGDRTLTARLVRDIIAEARQEKERVNGYNQRVVEVFLGQELAPDSADYLLKWHDGPPHRLEASLDEVCAREGITDPEDKKTLLTRLAIHLMTQANEGAFHPQVLTLEALHNKITGDLSTLLSINEGRAIIKSQTLSGTLADRLQLADMGIGKNGGLAFSRAIERLDEIRGNPPVPGPLTPNMVYWGLFNGEPPPAGFDAKAIVAEINARCDREMAELLRSAGENKRAVITAAAPMIPWETLVSLVKRPNTLSLENAPKLAAFVTGQKNIKTVEHHLLIDPQRVKAGTVTGPDGEVTALAPTFSFQFPDEAGNMRTESVQVGRDTDFFSRREAEAAGSLKGPALEEFRKRNEADKTNYLAGIKNPLAERLKELCGQVSGPVIPEPPPRMIIRPMTSIPRPPAGEAQLANTMACLTQLAKSSLSFASSLAGARFNEHSHVNVSLSRQDDGSVRAEFSSPEELREAQGHFKMSLAIAPDGATKVTEFQITPRREVLEARGDYGKAEAAEARQARIDNAEAIARPFCSIDDSLNDDPDSLFAEIQARARAVCPEARLHPESWTGADNLDGLIGYRIHDLADKSEAPLTLARILETRDGLLDAYFDKLNAVAARVPEEQRAAFTRACLELGAIPDETLLPAIQQMTGTVAHAFGNILAARDGREAMDLMVALNQSMYSATYLNPDFAGRSPEFFPPAMHLAVRLGLLNLAGGDTPEAFAALTRPGPFRDMLYDLHHDDTDESDTVFFQLGTWFLGGMSNLLPDADIQPSEIRERDLSLPRQREILGEGNYAARKVDVAVPKLADLNRSLGWDMPVLKAYIRECAERELRLGPGNANGLKAGPREADTGLSSQFATDYPREGVFVNGRYHHPEYTKTSARDFMALFPDARAAGLISNLAAQNLAGLFWDSLATAKPQTSGSVIIQQILLNPALAGQSDGRRQNTRIDVLDASQGRYRITAFQNLASGDKNSGVERFMYEVAVDVNLGAPGPGPRPQPAVEDVHLDLLVRGRQAVPGER